MSVASEVSRLEQERDEWMQLALKESLADKILQLEDIGWTRIPGKQNGRGLELSDLHRIVPDLRDAAATQPLHIRGAQLRHAYVFGRGIDIANVSPKTERAIEDPYNQDTLFSVGAHETANLELFCAGMFVILRDESTNRLMRVPVEDITADVRNPDDNSEIRFFLRSWTTMDPNGKPVETQRWYPVSRYKRSLIGRGKRGGSLPRTIEVGGKNIEVSQSHVAYVQFTKRQSGWAYGVPDSLGGAVWAAAYSGYLQDNALLVKALQRIAWTVTSASAGASKRKAAVSEATGTGIGGTAFISTGNSLTNAGVPSAQVDFNKGQPLAALVATAFGVPVLALLSSPGATGGSYGAVASLDVPTVKGMKAVQDSWKQFYKELLSDMGSPSALVTFPSLEQDPAFREVQSVTTARAAGLLHQDEAREGVLNILDVRKLHDELPEEKDYTPPSQGVTGSVPGGADQDVTPTE